MIKDEWKDYYIFLEAIRRTGVCNMLGADIYLREAFPLDVENSRKILSNWIENYSELNELYGWRN